MERSEVSPPRLNIFKNVLRPLGDVSSTSLPLKVLRKGKIPESSSEYQKRDYKGTKTELKDKQPTKEIIAELKNKLHIYCVS